MTDYKRRETAHEILPESEKHKNLHQNPPLWSMLCQRRIKEVSLETAEFVVDEEGHGQGAVVFQIAATFSILCYVKKVGDA